MNVWLCVIMFTELRIYEVLLTVRTSIFFFFYPSSFQQRHQKDDDEMRDVTYYTRVRMYIFINIARY